jgi:hypothetical protein
MHHVLEWRRLTEERAAGGVVAADGIVAADGVAAEFKKLTEQARGGRQSYQRVPPYGVFS